MNDGGPREVILRSRRWAARALAPDSVKSRPARSSAPRRSGPSTAANVSFAEATRFFQRRQANYEKLADAIAPHLPRDGVLFDIGANIGYFSKVVGERTGFQGSAHLFEPLPHLAQFCFRSLANADFSVAVHQYGLSDGDGHVDIFIDTQGNFGWNTMIGERASGMSPQRITVRRFEGMGLEIVPSVIKIDVEGAEFLVLRGLLPALERWGSRPPILCEIGWGATGHPNWAAELAVFAELAQLGYRATDLDGDPVELAEITATCDVLFLPS